jgi:UDP-glucose 4-epimerase
MTRYLVTGGAGFIGSHLVETLSRRGDHVRVLDNFSTGKIENLAHLPEVKIVQGDVCDAAIVRAATAGIDYVIHCAAQVSVPQSMADPIATHAVNVSGTLNVLQAAREFGVKRVVLASSCAVYGDNDDLPLSETSIPKPMSPYAATKLIGEIYCQTFYRAYGVPTVCLRYFNIFGPRQDPNGAYAAVIAKFVPRIRQGRAPIIYGDGTQTRDFVFVSDVVRANLLACERDEAIGQVFNIASGCAVSLLELIDALNQLLNTNITAEFAAPRTGDITHSRGNNSKGAAVLGFQPTVSFVDGLKQILNDQP